MMPEAPSSSEIWGLSPGAQGGQKGTHEGEPRAKRARVLGKERIWGH